MYVSGPSHSYDVYQVHQKQVYFEVIFITRPYVPASKYNMKRRITIFTIQLGVTKLLNTSACTEMYKALN
jgi:hypothetical protein